MYQTANKVLFSAVVAVLLALLGSIVLMATQTPSIALFTVILIPPIALWMIRRYRSIQAGWIELDCLPPYRTRSRYE